MLFNIISINIMLIQSVKIVSRCEMSSGPPRPGEDPEFDRMVAEAMAQKKKQQQQRQQQQQQQPEQQFQQQGLHGGGT